MSNFDLIPTWFHLFEIGREIMEFDDLNIEFNSLIAKVERNREIYDADNDEFYTIIKKQRRRIIVDLCYNLKDKIKKNKISEDNASSYLKRIEGCRIKSEEDLDIEKYDEIIRNLIDIDNGIERKISNDKNKKYQSKKMLGFVFFLGVLSSIIGGYFIFIFMK